MLFGVGVLLLFYSVQAAVSPTESSQCLDVGFPSGGDLVSTDLVSSCSRQIGESCNVICPNDEIRTVFCDPDYYSWDNTDPCAAVPSIESFQCPDVEFPSGGVLASSCSKMMGETCNVICPSDETRSVYCDPNYYTWDNTDPCAAVSPTESSQCPDVVFPSGGDLVSADMSSSCSKQIGESCNVICPNDEIRTVYCDPAYHSWDNTDPCAAVPPTESFQCPDVEFPSGGMLASSCLKVMGETCDVICPSDETRSVYCDPNYYTWDNTDPCADITVTPTTAPTIAAPFRLYVTDATGNVYSVDNTGVATQEYGIYGAADIAIDPLMSKTDIPNLVYGNDTVYSRSLMGGADEIVLNARDYGGNARRLKLDPTSGNLFYISASDSSPYCNISVVSPTHDHVTLISGYQDIKDIAIHPQHGLLFFIGRDVMTESTPFIGMAFMDGASVNGEDHIFWSMDDRYSSPSGLAIDYYMNNRLYWADPSRMTVESCAYTGPCDETLSTFMTTTFPPNDILIDGEFLYYNNMVNSVITKVHLSDTADRTTFDIPGAGELNAMAVYSSDFLQLLDSPNEGCSKRKGLGDCSNLCLPSMVGSVCKCQEGVSMQFNGVTCVDATLCPDYIPGVSLSTACYRHKHEECDYDCTNSGTLTNTGASGRGKLRCEEGGFWNNSMPCEGTTASSVPTTGYLCPQEFPSGGYLTSSTEISCYGQPGQTCTVYCTSGADFTVTCHPNGTWDKTDPCSGSSYLCPSQFPSGGDLTSYNAGSCPRQTNEACLVTCDDGNAIDVYCTEAGFWDNQDPCSKFRIYVTSTADQAVYVLDEIGMTIDIVDGLHYPVRGIAVDSTNHSFVYSVDSTENGAWAYVFRKNVEDQPYSSVGKQVFAVIDPRATIERIAVDPKSGDIYYTGLIADATGASFIGVYYADGSQSQLINGLMTPRDIVLNTDYGIVFWSDVGSLVISSAAMNGTSKTDIVTGVSAYGLAIDLQESLLYWADNNTNEIKKSDFYGSYVGFFTAYPSGVTINDITIHGRLLYYTSYMPSMVYALPLDQNQYVRKKRQTQMLSFSVPAASSLDAIAIYNSSSAQGQTTTCPSGYYTDGAGGCIPCPIGTYRDVTSSSWCELCPSGYTTLNIGSTGPADCVEQNRCPPTFASGILNSITNSTCNRTAYETCDVDCPSGVYIPVMCYPNGTWDKTDPCSGSANLCPQTFASGGLLSSTTEAVSHCTGNPHEMCEVHCPSTEVTHMVTCNPNGTWDNTDPCSGSANLCPQTFASGGLLSSATEAVSHCTGNPHEMCEVHCPSTEVTHMVTCNPNGTWDNTDPCSDSANLCPQTFASGGFLNSVSGATCNGQPHESCEVECPSGVTHTIVCYPNGTWDKIDPCSVSDKNPTFRILVTNSSGIEIYSFNEAGQIMDIFNSAYKLPVHGGLAVDNFMSMSTSGTYNPSFVYSIDSGGTAGFFRQFLNGTSPVFITMVSNVRVERISIDSGSGNIYYTGINSGLLDVENVGLIGVVTPSGDQMTLIDDLMHPMDIVLHGEEGRMYWSDIGNLTIGSANMDGTGLEIVVLEVLAYGLALDHLERRLYWTEVASIESGSESSVMAYDLQEGTAIELQKIYHDRVLMDILIDGQFWYYTRKNVPEIGKVDKTVIENEVSFGYVPNVPNIGAIAVYSMDSIATPGSYVCRNRGGLGDCSTICLPSSFTSYSCHCPDNDLLLGDGRTCKNATRCPDTIKGGTFQEGCSFLKLGECGVVCEASPDTTWTIQCKKDGFWNSNPCSAECPVGYFANATAVGGCSPCPLGHYQNVSSSTTCQTCDPGYSTSYIGAMSAFDCYVECAPGTFWDNGECFTCPPGEVQPYSAQTECNPCEDGTEPNNITAPTYCIAACPQTFHSGGILTSSYKDACGRQPYEYCDVQCPQSGDTYQVHCNPNSTWTPEDPCLVSNPDFRIFATGYSSVYSFDESGELYDVFNSEDNLRIRGIAIDHFMPMSASGSHNPSLVYSVDRDGDADFYRHFLNLTGPEYITTVLHVRVERIAVDAGSGNIYYTGVSHRPLDVNYPGFIGMVTPSGEHMTVKDVLMRPMDIVLHGEEGRMYWSDVGSMTIASSYMNGTGLEIIEEGVEVYGVALDHLEYKLYWIEVIYPESEPMSSVKSYYIYGGSVEEQKLYHDLFLSDILIDGQYWYYTSNYTSEIGKVSKYAQEGKIGDDDVFVNGEELPYFGTIAVFPGDSSSVPRSYACQERDGLGDCSTICLPNSSYTHSCHCPDGDLLLEDGRTCKNATLCPNTIRGGRFHNKDSCSFFKLAVCGVICDGASTTYSIQCSEAGFWENPCSEPTTSVSTPTFSETASPSVSWSTQPSSSGHSQSDVNGTSQSQPTGPTPSEQTGPTPSEPTRSTPSEPTGQTPSQPTGPTPSEPTGPTPSEPTGPTPSEPTGPTPSGPTGPTSSDTMGPTPSEQTGPTPSQPTGPTPSQPTGPTSSQPTGPTPSETTGLTPSDPTGPAHSEPTGPTPSEHTGLTPSAPTGSVSSTADLESGSTESQVSRSTGGQATGSTESQVSGSTRGQATGSTVSQVSDSTEGQVTESTGGQVSSTGGQVTGSTRSQVSGSTGGQASRSTGGQFIGSTGNQGTTVAQTTATNQGSTTTAQTTTAGSATIGRNSQFIVNALIVLLVISLLNISF